MTKSIFISSAGSILIVLTILPAAGCIKNLQADASVHRIVVAADGSGQYTSVQAAVDAVPRDNTTPTVIAVRPGTYKERIVVPRGKRFVRFEGRSRN
jgi:pectinesterase